MDKKNKCDLFRYRLAASWAPTLPLCIWRERREGGGGALGRDAQPDNRVSSFCQEILQTESTERKRGEAKCL